jgi:plastocyanin
VTPSPRALALPTAALAVALALAGCGGSSGSGSTAGAGGTVAAQGPPTAQTATVTGTAHQTFSPSTVTAKTGTLTLTLVRSGVPHNLTFSDPSVGAPIPVSGPSTGTYRFPKPGTYPFSCTIHEGMTGKVVVS